MDNTESNEQPSTENIETEVVENSHDSILKINVRFDGTNWLNKNVDDDPSAPDLAENSVSVDLSNSQSSSSVAGTSQDSKTTLSEHIRSPSNEDSHDTDGEFEPTVESMIHEFDDESTLEEDEVGGEEDEEELDALAKESEMPLEELLKMYYGKPAGKNKSEKETGTSSDSENDNTKPDENKPTGPPRKLRSNNVLLSPIHHDSGDEDGDGDYAPAPEDWRKSPRIGEDFQVDSIPTKELQNPDYNCEGDELIWDPNKIDLEKVEQYLTTVSQLNSSNNASLLPCGSHLRDNEDALFLLKQCDNDAEEAVRQYKWRPPALSSDLHVWSESECKLFEQGLALFGKDFHLIHQNKVKTKSIGEIVKFYYVWKKTERYANFSAKTRLGKKKDMLHPGVTDYMERLLDETENTINNSTANNANYPIVQGHSAALQQHLSDLRVTRSNLRQGGSPSNYAELNRLLDSDFVDDIEMFDNIVPIAPVPNNLPSNLNSLYPSVSLPEIDPPINVGYRDPGNFAPYSTTGFQNLITSTNPVSKSPNDHQGHNLSPSFTPSIVTPSQPIVDPSKHSFRPLNPAETTSSNEFVSSTSAPLAPGLSSSGSSFSAVSSSRIVQREAESSPSSYYSAADSTSNFPDFNSSKRSVTENIMASDSKRQRLYEESETSPSDSNSSTEQNVVSSTSNLRRVAAVSSSTSDKKTDKHTDGEFTSSDIQSRDSIGDASRLVSC